MSFVSPKRFVVKSRETYALQSGTFIGAYVEFALYSIKKHVAAGTTAKISRETIEKQILEGIDKADLPIEHKMACYMAVSDTPLYCTSGLTRATDLAIWYLFGFLGSDATGAFAATSSHHAVWHRLHAHHERPKVRNCPSPALAD